VFFGTSTKAFLDVRIIRVFMRKIGHFILLIALLIWSFASFGQNSQPKEQPKSWLIYQDEISKLWKIQNEFLDHKNDLEGGQIFKQILFLKTATN
jgi:hypothetical protein